ncbi:MAG: HlyD family efflux transporter periplasmic adaptor subunit [Oscillospiraceae bacterium]|nr:HlyD family efflux transporter periplasmic adaptor subunit [Oscillospiraceae bacterium]
METKVKSREWVKTAAIVFLAVLLVLTFFSNTIMNYSLPEVATQMVEVGAISTRIRGSGTVSANEVYEVTISQTRKIASVLVREGQQVQVGDVLFRLETEDSEELKAAQERLDDMELSYQKTALQQSNATAEQKREVALAQQAYDTALTLYREYTDLEPEMLAVEKVQAEQELKELEQEYKQLQAEVSAIQDEISDLERDLADIDAETDWEEYEEIQDEIDDLERDLSGARRDAADCEADVLDQGAYVEHLAEASACAQDLTAKQSALDELLFRQGLGTSDALDLQATRDAIAKQRELVEKLSKEADGAEVTANVAGTVGEISVMAGSTVGAQMPLASIHVTDRGFAVSISVTAEQAKKVRVGDRAEPVNYWGGDLTATLEQISNDPSNPGKGKLLRFVIDGEVEPNQNLTLSIGQKSANFDCIVPNAAVRTDNNGSFVLAVVAKSSPLGNRYTATRVNVQELAKDDTHTAVSGLSMGDFVITTSNKPIEAGMQVRLVDAV